LGPISTALRRGILKRLEEIELCGCILGDEDIKDFMEAMEGSGYAEQLVCLEPSDCQIKGEGLRALTGLIAQDGLPALKSFVS